MAVPFAKIGKFSEDAALNLRLQEFQKNVEVSLRHLDTHKDDRYFVHLSAAAVSEAKPGDFWVLATEGQAIHLMLPRIQVADAGLRVAVLRTSASNAVTVHAIGTLVNGAATDAPAAGSMVVYTTDGLEWWSP